MMPRKVSILSDHDFVLPQTDDYSWMDLIWTGNPPGNLLLQFRYGFDVVTRGCDAFLTEGTRHAIICSFWKTILRAQKPRIICRPRLQPPSRNPVEYGYQIIKNRMLKGVHHFIVNTRSEIEDYSESWGIDKKKMSYMPFKINTQEELSNLDTEESRFIYSGGDSLRDYGTLFKALESVDVEAKVLTNLPLPGRTPPDNVEIIRNSGTFDEFYGPMAKAALAVFPIESGHIRGAGQGSFLGAMFLGKAVVVSDTPGIRDIIEDGQNGFIVPPDDPLMLREKIVELMSNSDMRRRVGQQARLDVLSKYTHERYVKNLFDIVAKCVA